MKLAHDFSEKTHLSKLSLITLVNRLCRDLKLCTFMFLQFVVQTCKEQQSTIVIGDKFLFLY